MTDDPLTDREAYIQIVADGLKRAVCLALGEADDPISQQEADRLWAQLRDSFLIDSLDAAWVEAETALPEGWLFNIGRTAGVGAFWCAQAVAPYPDLTSVAEYRATSPASALRALAAKLREMQP